MRSTCAGVLALCCGLANAQPVGVNLIVNGGAEAGDTSGWVNGGFQVNPAEGPAAGFGEFVFTAGLGPASGESLTQDVDVSGRAALIDGPGVEVSFSVYIQSRRAGADSDVGTATLSFLDAFGGTVDVVSFTDPSDTAFSWDRYGVDRAIPVGTRTVRVRLSARRDGGGTSTDAFFDEVVLSLGGGCNAADVAPLFGVLDIDDVLLFLDLFTASAPRADVAVPVGVFDIDDVLTFLDAFAGGCP